MRIWIGSGICAESPRVARMSEAISGSAVPHVAALMRATSETDIAGNAPVETPRLVDYHPHNSSDGRKHIMKRIVLLLISVLWLATAMGATAQDKYPSRPIKVLVP